MADETFSWLHLTDLHFGLKGQKGLWPNLREPWLDDLGALHDRSGPWDVVLFTGDLVQRGTSEEFRAMQAEVLERLWERLEALGSGGARLLAVPGNHDLYRPTDEDAAAETLLSGGFSRVAQKFWSLPDGPYRRVVSGAFGAYNEWWRQEARRPKALREGALPGDFVATLEAGGHRIGIMGLNTAFLQLGAGDYKGRLVWDARQFEVLCPEGVDVWVQDHELCLLLTHHGPDWLSAEARKHGETEIAPAGRFAAHLYGHMHEHELVYVRRGGSSKATRQLQGCSVFGLEALGDGSQARSHGYSAGRICFGERGAELRIWPRVATDGTGGWRYVPDYLHADLRDDQGTAPEEVGDHGKKRAPSRPVTASAPLPPPPPVPRSTLPGRRPFFGRTAELATVAAALSPEARTWGVVLDGPGGMGKTALALEAAHRAPAERYALKLWITAKNRDLHPDGEKPLKDQRVVDFDDLVLELALALGRDDLRRISAEDRPREVWRALAGSRALLVMDNLETLNPASRGRIFELLGTLPDGCRAIVTSRRRDAAYGGHALRLDRLERDAADELLAELGRHTAAVAALTEQDRARLYAETHGNPLLLVWTAGQLGRVTGRARTVDEAVARLQAADRQKGHGNDPLEYIFGDLVESFSTDELAVLAALAHFTEPARTAWLRSMTGLSENAALTALEDLAARSILVEVAASGAWLLPALAARYLRSRRPEWVADAGERLADEVMALALENGFQRHERFGVLDEAWPQITAALPTLLAGENGRLQRLCEALGTFLQYAGRWEERIALSTGAEARAVTSGDLPMAGQRAFDEGWTHYLLGRSGPVLACAQRAEEHWGSAGPSAPEQALLMQLRALGHSRAGDHEAALLTQREALRLTRTFSTNGDAVVTILNSIANELSDLRRLDEAESHYLEALAIAQSIASEEGIAYINGNLADLALLRQAWPEAENICRGTLDLAERLGRQDLIAGVRLNLAQALVHQGRGPEGLLHAERAVEIYTRLRSPDLAEAQETLALCQA